jgi:hypothetical protein
VKRAFAIAATLFLFQQTALAQKVELKVYNALGMEVATLLQEARPAGRNIVSFDAANLASGIYFYELHAGEFLQRQKMLLVR